MSALGQELRFNGHIEKVRAVTHPNTGPHGSSSSLPSHTNIHFCPPTNLEMDCVHARTVYRVKLDEKSVRCLPVVLRLRHSHTKRHTLAGSTFGMLPKVLGAALSAHSHFSPRSHTQTGSLLCEVVCVCLWIVIGCHVASLR